MTAGSFGVIGAGRKLILLLTLGVSFAAAETEYEPILWVDLLPAEDLQALLNPPPIVHYPSEEGPARQSLSRNDAGEFMAPGEDPFEKALVSTNVKPEMNDINVRLPGFVVPLEYDDKQRVTEFFLVPYFGACIHTPPPPPNQIVFVSYPSGLELPSIYQPFNVDGRLLTGITENFTATSAYRIEAAAISPYEEE